MSVFLLVNRNTGDVLTAGQAAYTSADSAKRGLVYWTGGWRRKRFGSSDEYAIVEVTNANTLAMISQKEAD